MDEPRVLALPLCITPEGQFARADGAESLLRLIQAMVGTTCEDEYGRISEFWKHAPWFGQYERFHRANADVEDQSALADALNVALHHLGVHWATVQQVRSVRDAEYGTRRFDVTLLVGDERRLVSAAMTP